MSNVAINNIEEDEILNEWQREPSLEEILKSVRHDLHVQGKSENEIFELTTVVIDYATGEETTFKACKKKYGVEITKEILRAKQGKKELEPEILQQIEEIHSGARLALKDADQKASRKGKYNTNTNNRSKQFVPIPFELMDNPEFKKLFKGQYLTYAVLRRYIIRQPFKYDHLNLYENYFLKGQLASSCSIGWLANCFGCSSNTIRKHIRELKNIGCFKVVKIPSKQAWDGQKHHIYIFGTHDGDKNQKFFIDDVFGMPIMPHGQGVQ